MKLDLKWEIPQWMMLGAMFALAAWRYPLTSGPIPVHWGIDGRVDRYGGRFEGLLLLPLIALAVYGLFLLLPKLDPGRANYAQFGRSFGALRTAILAFLLVIYGAILMATAGHSIDVSSIIMAAMGLLFIVMGALMGKIRPNWFVGVRTPWTLSSKTSWIKTHRAAGWVFVAIGVVQIVGGLVLSPQTAVTAMLTMTIGSSLGLMAYSYFVWRDADDKAPPAGTLPAE